MRILVADDDPVSCHILQGVLTGWGYEVVTASDGNQALAVLQSDSAPPMAILDWMMPGHEGDEICRAVRAGSGRYIYLILLTATKDDKAHLVHGIEAGADDYLIKPFDPHELRARLIAGRRVTDMQDQLITAREAMRELASRDALTGVWNHGAILDRLAQEVNRGRRTGQPVGAILADLDYFKQVNDTHGHLAGDAVLKETAARFSAAVRPYDPVGRYGGEEFLVVTPSCEMSGAAAIAERIRWLVSGTPVVFEGRSIPVTVSLGVGVAQPGSDPMTVLAAADAALYRAKETGRNRVHAGPAQPEVPAPVS